MEKLYFFYKDKFEGENIEYIFNYPQKKLTRNLTLRIKNKFNFNIFDNFLIKNKSLKEVINNFNNHPGINTNPLS